MDGVRFVAAADSRRALMRRLAEYVERRAAETLWAGDADRVRELLAESEYEDAVELYFALVGKRWDEEWVMLSDPLAS